MKIYVAHSRGFDFKKELYEPLKNSRLATEYKFVFPHEKGDGEFNSRKLFKDGCDAVVAEVSFASTGLGIELGWANVLKIPIFFVYKKGVTPSAALKEVSSSFGEYADSDELVRIVGKDLESINHS